MKKHLKLISFAAFASVMLGCQSAPTANTNTNTADTATVNAVAANVTNAAANTATAPAAGNAPTAVNSASTPTEVYKAAYKYRQNKDIEGLKRIFSKDVLEFLTMIGKEEKKSLDDQLREMCENPQYSTDESRNEKITGDRAALEYRDEDGSWKTMDFVKEDGMWKMSLPGGPDTGDDDEKADRKPVKKP